MLVVDTLSQKQQQKKIGKVSETLSQKQKNYKHKGCGFGSDGGVLASYAQGLNSIPNITKNYFFFKVGDFPLVFFLQPIAKDVRRDDQGYC
jgi:hypothetical protein